MLLICPTPQAAPGKLNCSKTEAAQALAALYDRLLTHLRAGCCLVNAVKAEMLMDAESLDLLLAWRVAQAAGPAAAQAVEDAWAEMEVGLGLLLHVTCWQVHVVACKAKQGWLEGMWLCYPLDMAPVPVSVEPLRHVLAGHFTSTSTHVSTFPLPRLQVNYDGISAGAWNCVLLQLFRVHLLGRVTPKALRALPGASGLTLPEDSVLLVRGLARAACLAVTCSGAQRDCCTQQSP
jgi:hypothetical protein